MCMYMCTWRIFAYVYLCIRICSGVCICVYLHVCICVFVFLCVCAFVYLFVYVHMCISVFVFAYMFMCVNMCIRICLCVCVYLLYESSNSSNKFWDPRLPGLESLWESEIQKGRGDSRRSHKVLGSHRKNRSFKRFARGVSWIYRANWVQKMGLKFTSGFHVRLSLFCGGGNRGRQVFLEMLKQLLQ